MKQRNCKCGCGSSINHKHPNAHFLNQKHKDRYWNVVNPRGKFAHLNSKHISFHDPEMDRHIFDLD